MFKSVFQWLHQHRPAWGVRPMWALSYALAAVMVVGVVLSYHLPGYGFTYLISFGDESFQRYDWTSDRDVVVFKHLQSPGYDGQYYAQLALDPWLEDPSLATTVDNLPYRARRILLSWTAHVFGMGHPQWVMNVFALQNLVSWLGMGVLLLHWFPPVSLDRAFRWFGTMFATGVCFSLASSLADGPSVLLLLLALYWWDRGHSWRATAVLAAGGLMKETNILGGAMLAPADWRSLRGWALGVGRGILVAAPILLWIVVVSARLDAGEGGGLAGEGNFALPFVAIWGKASELVKAGLRGEVPLNYLAVSWAAWVSLLVQAGFLLGRWRWSEAAWRLTVPFAALALVIGGANWDGHPGGVTRSLLPMLIGFNLLVPVGRKWWPVLVLGNLTMWFGPVQFAGPAETGYRVSVEQTAVTQSAGAGLQLEFPRPWYALEGDGEETWRWAADSAEIVLINTFSEPLVMDVSGAWAGWDERTLSIRQEERLWWSERAERRPTRWRLSGVLVPPGGSVLRFEADRPPVEGQGSDARPLSFRLFSLEIRGRPLSADTP